MSDNVLLQERLFLTEQENARLTKKLIEDQSQAIKGWSVVEELREKLKSLEQENKNKTNSINHMLETFIYIEDVCLDKRCIKAANDAIKKTRIDLSLSNSRKFTKEESESYNRAIGKRFVKEENSYNDLDK